MIKFLLSTLLLLAVSCAALEITLPEEINVEIGTTATITCSYATTEEVVTLKWYKKAAGGVRQRVMVISNGEMNLDGGYNGRPLISDADGSLILEDVTADDEKEFKNIFCVVEAGVGGDQTETEKATTFTVIVYPATNPVVELNREVFDIAENVMIGTCKSGEGHPKPTISFLKNGINAFPKDNDPFAEFTNDDIATVGSDGFSLVMKTSLVAPALSAEDDNAVFTCVAEVNGKTTRTDFPPIRVRYPTDTVTVTASSNPTNDGGTVTLTCEANGYPAASITSFGEGDAASIDITVTKEDDGRAITCYAANSGNIDPIESAAYTLNVNYLDAPTTTGDIDANLGDLLEPGCASVGTASDASAAWFKDGAPIVFPLAAQFDSAGTYTCISSAEGLPDTSAEITVAVTGLILETVGGDAVIDEKSATLSCTAQAIPAAKFSWTVTDSAGMVTELIDGVTDTKDGISVTSTVSLNDITSDLSKANITCTAEGTETKSAVFTMPEIATGGSAGIVIGILIGLLILAIVLYVLYSRGIICKDSDKEGVEDGNKDIEVGGGEPAAAAEEAQAEVATEEEKAPLTNGDGAQ